MNIMTVRKLRELLDTFDGDMPVCYRRYSEQCLLEAVDIEVVELQEPRGDGWVHDARPDKPTRKYLMLPGN
jgi:hypothetical protein